MNLKQLTTKQLIERKNALIDIFKARGLIKEHVLEFAKVIEKGEIMEEARMNFNYDNDTIARMMCETECPSCKIKGWNDILSIDFENSKVKSICPMCNGVNIYDLTPSVTVIKKGKKPEAIKGSEENKEKQNLAEGLENKESLKNEEKGGKEMDELLKKYNKATVEEIVSLLETENATLKAEIETHKKAIEDANTKVTGLTTEVGTAKAALKAKEDAEKASLVAARKSELGEFAKDMSDEDIVNDLKFENAKLKMENATLKATKTIEKSADNSGLEAGSKENKTIADKTFEKQSRIHKQAFGI